jgi:hypothetical protein
MLKCVNGKYSGDGGTQKLQSWPAYCSALAYKVTHLSLFHDSSTVECSIQKDVGKGREKLHFSIGLNEEKINCSSNISSLDYNRYYGCK